MNPCIADITCPHCGNVHGTVHRESKGKQALYYRCYGGPDGDCGTVQIRGPGGQKFIMQQMRPLEDLKIEQEAANAAGEVKAAARDVERIKQREKEMSHVRPGGEGDAQEKPKKRGFLNAILNEDDDD